MHPRTLKRIQEFNLELPKKCSNLGLQKSRCLPEPEAEKRASSYPDVGLRTTTMQTKSRFDPNSPEIKAYLNELAHQFVREGTMVAFPTCLPGMTTPITHDESRITALDINSEGHVYGGTSGLQAHLFGAAFHGLTGIALDAGTLPGSTSTEAICCGASGVIAFVNGPQGGRAVAMPHLDLAEDWIQEWGLEKPVLKDLGECVPGELVVHAIAAPSGRTVVGVTVRHLFTVDVESGLITVVGEAPGRGHLAMGRAGVFGQDEGSRLWRFDVASGDVRRAAVHLPDGEWTGPLRWARDRHTGLLFTADAAGRLFSFDENKGFRALGRTHLAPVGPMAMVPDGRLFGISAERGWRTCSAATRSQAVSTISGSPLPFLSSAAMATNSATPSPAPMVKSCSARTITAGICGSTFRKSRASAAHL